MRIIKAEENQLGSYFVTPACSFVKIVKFS